MPPEPADWVLDLVHQQGLITLPCRSLLTARLVCQHWKSRLSQDISHITLPYDAWATTSSTCSGSSAASTAVDLTGWRSAAAAAAAAMAAVAQDVGEDDAADPDAEAAQGLSARRKQPAGSELHQQRQQAVHLVTSHHQQQQQQQQKEEEEEGLHAADVEMVEAPSVHHGPFHGEQSAPAATAAVPAASKPPAASLAQRRQPQLGQAAAPHPLHLLPRSLPAVTHVTLSNRRSHFFDPQAPCGATAVGSTVALLSQLPKLHTVSVQGYMPAQDYQPLLLALATPPQQHHQHQGSAAAATTAAGVVGGAAPAEPQQGQEQQQQQGQQQQLLAQPQPQPQLVVCSQLVCLGLHNLEIPPPMLIEKLLVGLPGLRGLNLHASMESCLEAAHLEALAVGAQLTSLVLQVYQVTHSRCPLDPLMTLTHLQHLEVGYGGIFKDLRPVLVDSSALSGLVCLTSLSSRGLAQPLLPQPTTTALRSLRVAGLTKRLPEASIQLISSCSSSALQDLRLEGGRRGIAAVAADQLSHLGAMIQLTSLSLALSKGGLPAGKSARQLEKLSGLTALKTLVLGSGDHRLGLSTDLLTALGGQWPALESLRLSGFSPLQGFAGLGAFPGLTALSLKPGVGTGKLLLDLDVALQQLPRLRRLHLDFRSALQLEHIEAVVAACSDKLQHLSLNMWAPGIGSKALVAIGQLSELTSLQLMSLRAAVLSGPPGIVALRNMASLELLCVQAADEVITDQQPLALGGYLAEVLTGHEGPLREVVLWLGSGVEARQAEAGVVQVVEQSMPDCRCRVLKEPEKAIL